MPQTLLGFLGILLASFLALSQLRSGIDTDRKLETSETQALAAEVAMGQLEALELLPFDEAVVSDYADSVTDLTPYAGGRYVRVGQDDPGNDLDDVHDTAQASTHVLREGETGLALQTTTRVRYVSEADGITVSASPTRFKRVTVTVRPLDGSAPPVLLSQLYSCGSYCTW